MSTVGRSRQSRRLQISGGSTFVVSLPKVWIEEMKLKAGDTITMTKNPNRSLTFMPDDEIKQENQHAVAEIGQKTSDESIRRRIIAMYLAGYKSIKIIKLKPGQASVIRNLVRSTMIGTEIVESDSESMVIQILTRLPELSFDVALKRMHLMTTGMYREAIESLATADMDYASEVVKMDDEIDRFSLYMLRSLTMAVQNENVLQEMGLNRPSDCLAYRTVISRIERIADHAALIARRVEYLESPIDEKNMKSIITASNDALVIFERAVESLARCDYQMAESVADEIPRIARMQDPDDNSINASVIKFVMEDIRRTAEYSGDIAEVAMDRNIQSVITALEIE